MNMLEEHARERPRRKWWAKSSYERVVAGGMLPSPQPAPTVRYTTPKQVADMGVTVATLHQGIGGLWNGTDGVRSAFGSMLRSDCDSALPVGN